ncbi:MAG: hypothetical protein KatS3mg006_0850 [Pyrinomonadaceae bacterium]|jgi:hypothetical protein|nr:MAG: hypothetical protein KatS3mg006_0850 [Pyrinomonadaceae bacterium]
MKLSGILEEKADEVSSAFLLSVMRLGFLQEGQGKPFVFFAFRLFSFNI